MRELFVLLVLLCCSFIQRLNYSEFLILIISISFIGYDERRSNVAIKNTILLWGTTEHFSASSCCFL